MSNRRSQGNRFEDTACTYLAGKGYKILDRNVYLMRKELDIVAMEGDTIVFVEVKGRTSSSYGRPVEAVNAAKQRRLVMAATVYLKREGLLDRSCRFDVVGISLRPGDGPRIEHIRNAFQGRE